METDTPSPENAASADYDYIESRAKLHNVGFTDNKPGSSIQDCLEFHTSRMSAELKQQTNQHHYRFIKVMQHLDFELMLTLDEVVRLYIQHGGNAAHSPTKIKQLLFSSDRGIPCYIAVLIDAASDDHRQTDTVFVIKTAPTDFLLKYLVRRNQDSAHYIQEFKKALSSVLKTNNKKAKSLNSRLAVTLNKQIANAVQMSAWKQKQLGFRQLSGDESTAFDARIDKCAKHEPDIAVLRDELRAKEQRLKKSIARLSTLLRDPGLAKQKRNALKIQITKSKIKLLEIKNGHESILSRLKAYLKRKNKQCIKQQADKMNKGGKGSKVCITSNCKRFLELYVENKFDALDADDRRKYDRISLNYGTTNRSEIEHLCYLYGGACKFLQSAHFDVDPSIALQTLLAHPSEIELLAQDLVTDGVFSMSKSSVSEFAHQGRRRTIQAKRCVKRGSMNIAFANKAKITRPKSHPNHEFCRSTLTQRQVSLARLPHRQMIETVSSSQDCGAIRKFGTHEGNDARRNKRSLHLIGILFGHPISSVYANPATYIRPTVMVLNRGLYDPQTGRATRCGVHRDQYISISPKTVAYGNAFDMFNQYEFVLLTMYDMVNEDGSGFKEGAVEKKSHALSLSHETFTFDTYKYQLSFLKFLTRARLLKQLLD